MYLLKAQEEGSSHVNGCHNRDGRMAARFRRFFLRPVAALLVLSFVPPDVRVIKIFPAAEAAQAPIINSLPSNCSQIGEGFLIQRVCNPTVNLPPGAPLVAAIKQFEYDTINAFLAFYNIPVNDNNVSFFFISIRARWGCATPCARFSKRA